MVISFFNRSRQIATLFFILFFSLIACSEKSQPIEQDRFQYYDDEKRVELTISFEPKPIYLYDKIYLKIQIKANSDHYIKAPFLPKAMLDDFIILNQPEEMIEVFWENDQEFWIKKLIYILQAKKAGQATIPAFKYSFYLHAEKPQNSLDEWNTFFVDVAAHHLVIKDQTQDYSKSLDEKITPIQAKIDYIWLIIGFVIVLALFFVGLYIIKRYFTQEEQGALVYDYRKITLSALENLKRKNYLESGLVEEYHIDLTNLLRQFLEKYLGEKSEKKTTEEFFSGLLDSQRFTSGQKKLLRDYLSLSDQVKFAGFQPDAQTNIDAFNKVEEIVLYFIKK